ncbi:TPM domain-containing protein [Mesobacillus maritimus]|uniref:TPM domain-containing protein n=1 Tax=Mesobacillus maritimus TaxID=1643336 RepID=UPI00203A4144|nr:TPM domain-containing protein [Mesobacillus maritimus]MCM3584688.1 TPM domain-containing protein [Mesobacillus maritimus]MCM3671288.1 TPM domain-containing protein [Mesobacillus maritimus]
MVKLKKTFALLPLMLVLMFAFCINVFAAYEKVYDEADLFSEKERADLNEQAIALSEQTEMDIVIVTTNNSQGKSSSDYALDFYEEHGFGYEGTLDGVLYLLNMDEREVYIFTRDKGTDYIDASRVEELLDRVYPPLGEESYRESAQIFLEEVESMMAAGPPVYDTGGSGESGYAYTEEGSTADGLGMIEKLGIYLLISLAIGGIVIGIMMMGNKGRSTVNARTYLEDNSFTITKKRDQHYNTIVTQQKIQQNNNSGGSTFSGGGGGGGIGGGGRKF